MDFPGGVKIRSLKHTLLLYTNAHAYKYQTYVKTYLKINLILLNTLNVCLTLGNRGVYVKCVLAKRLLVYRSCLQ